MTPLWGRYVSEYCVHFTDWELEALIQSSLNQWESSHWFQCALWHGVKVRKWAVSPRNTLEDHTPLLMHRTWKQSSSACSTCKIAHLKAMQQNERWRKFLKWWAIKMIFCHGQSSPSFPCYYGFLLIFVIDFYSCTIFKYLEGDVVQWVQQETMGPIPIAVHSL